MLGGLVTSAFLTLEVIPALYTIWRTRQLRCTPARRSARAGARRRRRAAGRRVPDPGRWPLGASCRPRPFGRRMTRMVEPLAGPNGGRGHDDDAIRIAQDCPGGTGRDLHRCGRLWRQLERLLSERGRGMGPHGERRPGFMSAWRRSRHQRRQHERDVCLLGRSAAHPRSGRGREPQYRFRRSSTRRAPASLRRRR